MQEGQSGRSRIREGRSLVAMELLRVRGFNYRACSAWGGSGLTSWLQSARVIIRMS